jgi:alanyl-tRNA synthetase
MVFPMTERLYYTDSYLREFRASVADRGEDGLTVYLDRTAFYPDSGGQPHDVGSIAGVAVLDVIDEEERIAHRVAAPVPDGEVECALDWERRWDHMQQHSGQHLLSAVLYDHFGFRTVSFHLGAEVSTIDVEGAPDARALAEAELMANRIVTENREIAVAFEDATEAEGLRKASERIGTLRIVAIEALDRSACGGTHVRRTGEIGPILMRKLEKVRNTTRIEFLCGQRAVRRARADYDSLSRTAQALCAQLDETPALVAAQVEAARAADKARRKLEIELAGYQGRALFEKTEPDASGARRVTRRLATGNLEDLRALAQNFAAQGNAVFLAAIENPPSVLLAASEGSGLDAGKLVKAAVTAAGGRGGGTARIAQGSVPKAELLADVLAKLG